MAVRRGDADSQHRPFPHLRDGADGDGRSLGGGLQHDLLDVGERADEALPADDVLLAVVLDVAAAGVRVASLDGLEDLLQGQAVRPQFRGIDDDLVLLRKAAPGVDLCDAGNGAQPGRDHPVEDRPALHRGDAVSLDCELEDVAEPGRDRTQLGSAQTLRDRFACLDEALGDELAGEVEVDSVLEDDRHRREAIAGDRADLLELRKAVHRGLHRVRHELLHLHGPEGRSLREDLYLDVRDVGLGVDRELRQGVGAAGDEEDRGQ